MGETARGGAIHGRARAIGLIAAVALVSLPALSASFFHDDLVHRIALEGGTADYHPEAHQLYDFVGGPVADAERMKAIGYLPWITQDGLTLRFFRPLSSLSLAVDHWLFGRSALAAHLHSALWFIALALIVWRLHRRLLPRPSAGLASAIYLLAGAHTTGLAWIAARHVLISATLTLGALSLYVHGRSERRPLAIAGAALLFVLGLVSSESTLELVPLVVFYELFVPTERPAGRRAMAAAPFALIALAYLVFYGLQGYGAHGSGAYLSPFDSPLAFAAGFFTRMPPLLAELYAGVPVLIWSAAAPIRVALWIIGASAFAAVVAILVRRRGAMERDERRHLLWLGAASVGCLVPMVGTILDGRLLVVALFPASALVASAIVHGWRRAREHESRVRRLALRLVVAALTFGALGLSPFVRVGLGLATAHFADAEKHLAESMDLERCAPGDDLYVLTAADPLIALYTEQSLVFYEPERRARYDRIRVLSMAPHDQTLTMEAGGFTLAVTESPRATPLTEEVYRERPLQPGDTFSTEELQVTVLEAQDVFPTRTRFASDEPFCLLQWNGEKLVAIDPPPVGGERAVEHVLGPMGL